MHKKIALSLLLTTLILTSFVVLPVFATVTFGHEATETWTDWEGNSYDTRQIIAYGMLHDELFPEFNYTRWQRRSINVGFTAYGEMVTDQDPFDTGSKYGVGLQYPTDSAWQVDMAEDEDGTDYGIYPCEHIATPALSGEEWRYYPIEGWQLYWKFKEGTPSFSVDPWWHVSMAIYGNLSSPFTDRARVDVEPVSVTVITDTSRLFIAKVVVRTNNETLHTAFGYEPKLFEITALYVFFKNTKKVASYWTIEYLKTEYGPVDVVFRRMTDFDIDQKFQEGEDECFAQFFPTSGRQTADIPGETTFKLDGDPMTWANPATVSGDDEHPIDPPYHNHMFWTGCEYWPQNYSLAVVWTNDTIEHWVPPEGYSVKPQHHVGFVAYYPNCSNWDTDNWNHFTYNLHRPTEPAWLFFGEGLGRRFSGQPVSVEFRDCYADGAAHYAGANLLLGQWNFTISSTTAYKKAKFLTVLGVTNCSDTFGYVGNCSSYDWDSRTDYGGQVTVSEIKYLLSEFFNATYKLSTETTDGVDGLEPLDLSVWYPFSGVKWDGLTERDGNVWIDREIGCDGGYDPRNTTFIIGDSAVHYDTVTSEGAATIDVVGAVMVGEAFGAFVDWGCLSCPEDPMWLAMYDIEAFSALATAPYYTLEKDSLVYFDPVTVTLKLTGWIRRAGKACGQLSPAGAETGVPLYWHYFTTPTGCSWDVNHTINIGGPRVNLGTAYFNDHNFLVWVDPDVTGSELSEAGIFSIPTLNFYPESEGGISVITITEDLNLTSWTAVHDDMRLLDDDLEGCGGLYQTNATNGVTDGPTLIDPYAGLSIWGISGIDTHAASYFLAHYWCEFNTLYINETAEKRGATAIVLNTGKMADVCPGDWMHAIQEIIGPPAGRWRFETGTTWGPWISYPTSIDWAE